MRINKETTPEATVQELAGRLAHYRMERGITQAQLAEQAGVGKRTIERIENGCDTQLTTLIRLLQALGLSDRLAQLIPEPTVSPMDLLHGQIEPPKRAKRKPADKKEKPWKWGDEQ